MVSDIVDEKNGYLALTNEEFATASATAMERGLLPLGIWRVKRGLPDQ